jgi:anti-sigma regulatory factor (Ser/Thr protein kinase)
MSPHTEHGPQSTRRPPGSPRDRAPDTSGIWSYAAVPESVREVRNAAVEFAQAAGAGDDTVEAVRLTCSEAAANVVEHAYGATPGDIALTAELDADAIWIVVADHGCGMAFGNSEPGLGLGILWMAWFSDGLTLRASETGGLEVTLRFSLR